MSNRVAPFVRRLATSSVAHNAAVLYAVYVASSVIPLLTVPYLARVLRPEGWGLLVFAQSFSIWLVQVVDYGFALSAPRMIAQRRNETDHVEKIVASVQGAKMLLLTFVLLVAAVAWWAVPLFRLHPAYLLLAVLVAIVQGFSPFWYFYGVERMKVAALAEVLGKVAAAAGIFLWVETPDQGWLVLLLQLCSAVTIVSLLTLRLYREVRFMRATVRDSWETLRGATAMFVFRSASGLYTMANSFLLGIFAGPRAVGFYGGAEKIARTIAVNLLGPVSVALYPRASRMVVTERGKAERLVRLSLLGAGAIGIAAGGVIFAVAPMLIRLLLGAGYEPSILSSESSPCCSPFLHSARSWGISGHFPWGLSGRSTGVCSRAGS